MVKHQMGRDIPIQLKIDEVETKCDVHVRQIITIIQLYVSHVCKKILDSNFTLKAVN